MADGRVNNGGARPNSGRKPSRERHEPKIVAAENKIARQLPSLLERMFEIAHGGYRMVEGQHVTGFGGVLETIPVKEQRLALEYLMNRLMGKPTERQELTGKDGGAVQVEATNDLSIYATDELRRILADFATAGDGTADKAGDS